MFFLIILTTVLFFFCLYLYFQIKKLKEKITNIELDTKTILERKLYNHKEDTISINNISNDIPKDKLEEKNTSKYLTKIKEISQEEDNILAKPKPYIARTNINEENIPDFKEPTDTSIIKETLSKNIKIEELSKEKTSPKQEKTVSIETTPNSNVTLDNDFDPINFIKIPKKQANNNIERTSTTSTDYLQEISHNLQEELTPQTIELTGYEKIQEEQAIISYKELLSLKEKIKNQDKQDEQFLETLKELRNLLN